MSFILLFIGSIVVALKYEMIGYALMIVGFIMHLTAPAEAGGTVKRAIGYIVLTAFTIAIPILYQKYYYHQI